MQVERGDMGGAGELGGECAGKARGQVLVEEQLHAACAWTVCFPAEAA